MGTYERRSHTQSMLPCSQNPTPCSARIFLNPCLTRFFQPAILIKALRKNTHIAALWEPVNGGHIHKVCSLVHVTPRLALHAFFSILVSHDFFQPAILIKTLRKNMRIAVLQESADIDIWQGGPLRPPDKFIRNTSFFITLNPTPKT